MDVRSPAFFHHCVTDGSLWSRHSGQWLMSTVFSQSFDMMSRTRMTPIAEVPDLKSVPQTGPGATGGDRCVAAPR